MASEVVVVKEGFLKCPQFGKDISFQKRWPRYYCAMVAFNSTSGQGHYYLYLFNQQQSRIKQVIANLPSPAELGVDTQPSVGAEENSTAVPPTPTPATTDGSGLAAKPLPLRNCYYLQRCHRQHSLHKNIFSVVFSHASYFIACDNRTDMDSWIMALCEHLDVNCEEDYQPRPREVLMEQCSLSTFRSTSLKLKFGEKSSRPNTLTLPVTMTAATTFSALHNPATGASHSSPSAGSIGSFGSLGTGDSSDVSLTSARTNQQSSESSQLPVVISSAGDSTNTRDEFCGATTTCGFSMKEYTPGSTTGLARPTLIPLASSQDSLYQVDSGVSYDRDSTPGSILNPENSDIVYPCSSLCQIEDPFTRSRADGIDHISPLRASSRQRSVSMNSGSEHVATTNSDVQIQISEGHETMPHRTPAILTGSIPQMTRGAQSVHNLAPSLSFSYGPVPNLVNPHLRRVGSLERDSYRRYSSFNRAAEAGNGSTRSSPALLTPSARSMVNLKLSIGIEKRHVAGRLLLVDAFNYVWVAGWNPQSQSLNHIFHVGDRVLSVNSSPCTKASAANGEVERSSSDIEFVIVRTPLGNEISISRQSSSEILGLMLRKNTVTGILPNTAAARSGISPQAQGISGKLVPWVVTQINSVPVDLFNSDRDKVTDQLHASGFFATLLLQPKDFVKALKKKIRSSPNCKYYTQPATAGILSSQCEIVGVPNTIHVRLLKSRPTIGIVLNGGADTPGHALTIHSVAEDGIAHDDGFLKEGMEMLAVDGASLVGLAHLAAVNLIRRCFESQRPYLEFVVKASNQ